MKGGSIGHSQNDVLFDKIGVPCSEFHASKYTFCYTVKNLRLVELQSEPRTTDSRAGSAFSFYIKVVTI